METECSPCNRQDKEKKAVTWCVQCQEPLCKECLAFHKYLKVTKDHGFITIGQYESVSDILSSIQITCEIHENEPLEYFCSKHNALCCIVCKCNDHKGCSSVERFEKVHLNKEQEEKSARSVTTLDKTILSTEFAIQNRSKNIEFLHQFRGEFVATVQNKKANIQKVLEDLDIAIQDFDKECFSSRQDLQREKQELDTVLGQLKQKRDTLVSLSQLRNVGSPHFFLAELKMQKQNEKYETDIDKNLQNVSTLDGKFSIMFKNDDQNENIDLVRDFSITFVQCKESGENSKFLEGDFSTLEAEGEYFIDKKTNSKTNAVESLNSDTEIEESIKGKKGANLLLKSEASITKAGNQANTQYKKKQLFSERYFFRKKYHVLYKYKSHFHVEKKNPDNPDVTVGCVQVLPSGQIVLAEWSDPRLLVYEKRGYRKGVMKLRFNAESIAVIDDRNIALTLDQSILIIDIRNYSAMKIVRKIELFDNCYGIAYVDSYLVVNCENQGLKILTLEGKEENTHSHVKGVLNICPGKEKTIVSTKKNSEVVLFYNLASKYQTPIRCQNLLGANGITQNKRGNVFVASGHSNKVYMLPYGSHRWISVLDKDSLIDNPSSIAYDTRTNDLVVVNKGGKSIIIYQREIKEIPCRGDSEDIK